MRASVAGFIYKKAIFSGDIMITVLQSTSTVVLCLILVVGQLQASDLTTPLLRDDDTVDTASLAGVVVGGGAGAGAGSGEAEALVVDEKTSQQVRKALLESQKTTPEVFNLLVYMLQRPDYPLTDVLTVDQAITLLAAFATDGRYLVALLKRHLGRELCVRLGIASGEDMQKKTCSLIKGLLEEHKYPDVGLFRVVELEPSKFRRKVEGGVAAAAALFSRSHTSSRDQDLLRTALERVAREDPDEYNFIVASIDPDTAPGAPGALNFVNAVELLNGFIAHDAYLSNLLTVVLGKQLARKLGVSDTVPPATITYLCTFFIRNELPFVGGLCVRVG